MIHHRGPWRNLDADAYATLDWVGWLNHLRLLETVGSIQPAEFESMYHRQLEESAATARFKPFVSRFPEAIQLLERRHNDP